jgi:adenylate cyclase
MGKLIAVFEEQGKPPGKRWEKEFEGETPVSLGRGAVSDWVADWEDSLSRKHAILKASRGQIEVEVLAGATNSLYFHGKAYPPSSKFVVHPGEQFTINRSTFKFHEERPTVALDGPTPDGNKTVCVQDLDRLPFIDADKRMNALADFHTAIRDTNDQEAIDTEVLKVLLKGIPLADAVSIAAMPPRDASSSEVTVLATRFRTPLPGDFQPSRKLIVESIHTMKEPVVHTWDSASSGLLKPSTSGDAAASASQFDWAFCLPMTQIGSGDRLGLYVTGHAPSQLRGRDQEEDQRINRDLKFAELVAKVYASYRRVASLQKRNDVLGRFLSRSVRQALARQEINHVLRPREVPVTVLFCDLRGSCRISEECQDDLTGLWSRISGALSLMTAGIVDQDGVIGDFQGDAAMGFWGWPLETSDQVERAARAAIAIRRGFQQASRTEGHPLAGFACGIGIAHGRAIAGALGTAEQFKISVYGPTVNLASRLESLTKVFKIPILIDEAAASKLANTPYACRRLAKIRPLGLIHPITVSELFEPETSMTMADDERDDFAVGYDLFVSGSWEKARRKLVELPNDGPSQLLLKTMQEYPTGPPKDWDGVIVLKSK